MATVCGKLNGGLDLSCGKPVSSYAQKAVLWNVDDVDPESKAIDKDCDTDKYDVDFKLKQGTSGFAFIGPKNGSVIRGITSKTTDDNGFVQYQHKIQILFGGTEAEAKCILEGLDKGKVQGALLTGDDQVEIYGFKNGLASDDYDLDIVDGGGAVVITLQSLDDSQEPDLPYIYNPEAGDALADFESLFENAS